MDEEEEKRSASHNTIFNFFAPAPQDAQEASWDQAVRRAEAGAGGRPDPYAPAPTLSAPLPSINRDPAAAAPFFSASGPAIPASFASAMVPQTAAPAPAPQHENDADATFCLDDFDLEIASSSDGYSPEDAFEGGEGYAQDQGRGQGQGGTMRVELPPHLARGGEMSSWAGREGGNGCVVWDGGALVISTPIQLVVHSLCARTTISLLPYFISPSCQVSVCVCS